MAKKKIYPPDYIQGLKRNMTYDTLLYYLFFSGVTVTITPGNKVKNKYGVYVIDTITMRLEGPRVAVERKYPTYYIMRRELVELIQEYNRETQNLRDV